MLPYDSTYDHANGTGKKTEEREREKVGQNEKECRTTFVLKFKGSKVLK